MTNDRCEPSNREQVVLSGEDIQSADRESSRLYANSFSLPCPKVGSKEFIIHKEP